MIINAYAMSDGQFNHYPSCQTIHEEFIRISGVAGKKRL